MDVTPTVPLRAFCITAGRSRYLYPVIRTGTCLPPTFTVLPALPPPRLDMAVLVGCPTIPSHCRTTFNTCYAAFAAFAPHSDCTPSINTMVFGICRMVVTTPHLFPFSCHIPLSPPFYPVPRPHCCWWTLQCPTTTPCEAMKHRPVPHTRVDPPAQHIPATCTANTFGVLPPPPGSTFFPYPSR